MSDYTSLSKAEYSFDSFEDFIESYKSKPKKPRFANTDDIHYEYCLSKEGQEIIQNIWDSYKDLV